MFHRLHSLVALCALAPTLAAQRALPSPLPGHVAVTATQPAALSVAPGNTPISVLFDRPLRRTSIDADTFRVFGRQSGPVPGTFLFSSLDRRVTFVPAHAFVAGDVVSVNLSHAIRDLRAQPLRDGGYAFQFRIAVKPSGTFTQYGTLSTRNGTGATRLYGAAVTDLNHDGALDLISVNEDSADLRVFLNLNDGAGHYGSFLTPQHVGFGSSPNETADFDNDGETDLCVAAFNDSAVWVSMGHGTGTFFSASRTPTSGFPAGIAVLDMDGDGDMDIAATSQTSDLWLIRNDKDHGAGFATPVARPTSLLNGYGLGAGDMDGDGLADLVLTSTSAQIQTLLGNGDGTFHAAGTVIALGGGSNSNPLLTLGDVDGDGDLDVAAVKDSAASLARNKGDGTFSAPIAYFTSGTVLISSDLGDLDGDGDLDWSISSGGLQRWRLFQNDGAGAFSFWQDILAPQFPSCSVLLDTDGDGDLDLALTDEDRDQIVLMRNH